MGVLMVRETVVCTAKRQVCKPHDTAYTPQDTTEQIEDLLRKLQERPNFVYITAQKRNYVKTLHGEHRRMPGNTGVDRRRLL